MSRLAGFPKGFLDLLGSQNFGVNPKELAEQIVPTVDMSEFYKASKLEVIFNSGTDVIATGGNSAAIYTLQVPLGELWLVKAVSLFLSAGVGGSGTATPTLQVNAGNMSIGQGATLVASTIRWNTATVVDLVAPAGSRFGIWGSECTAPFNGALTVLAARLRA